MIVNSNGGTVYCEVIGQGPALLIPGHASTPRFFKRVEQFSNEFTVIGVDVRGEAMETHFPSVDFTLDDCADDTVGVLDALGIPSAHFLGLSHTGMLGLAMALRHPARIDRLVLTNTGPGLESEKAGDHALPVPEGEYTDAFNASEEGDAGIRQLSELAFSPAAMQANPSLADNTVNHVFAPIFAMPAEERAAVWKAYGSFGVRDRLSEITQPTFIMTSDADRMAQPEDHWLMWNRIPRAVLLALHGIGHDWYAEAPEVGARVIKSFLRGELDPVYV